MPITNKTLRRGFLAAISTLAFAGPLLAGDITVQDAYARASGAKAKSGAIFMEIVNSGTSDDRLVAAQAEIAKKVELHTHIENDNGVMQMRQVEGGFVVPAEGTHLLMRGGDHVMLMGLTGPMTQDDMLELTLEFEHAGSIVIQVPVDLKRKPMKHGNN